ncbi:MULTISPECIES: MotA/TolQ/ExbB proton channel family protein [Paraburkholderia]|jgi:biopolymer transport protein ExbB|uniref:Tol-Pal system protein TolQ n=1 Tax=Paraburkholderia aspalathi TaxID=1324617 RepID=A0ABN7KSZ0_9BURK|nr:MULTISPECIES: MotA/TolQ/ExbB proton channel family protein [Paraburkholderia]MCP2088332.1 biopolymer transport protein ExbB [Paraburkholderia sediminicola]MBK3817616.1 MotA/TolQ/ExbB proton channel family protein [Paraburkholderia aspalathi]MBK3829487.1 MotA/TolQ/ExbB proton channel family protein [Paraburkholderia aspalathi]MBK3859172.1 MotA/TolQ/ExbB proton channel family protein [Paraburkholderia aspalathi]MCX4139685.1 MotA/TolQ/ExbB proton channel family protein [Paraburkholderia aspala
MQDWTSVLAAVRVGGWVIYPLTILAILAVAIALDRAYVFLRFGRLSGTLRGTHEIAAAGSALDWAGRLKDVSSQNAFRRMSAPWAPDPSVPLWLREAKAQSVAAQIERDMSKGFWVLETIVTAAPLLGLLGTIVGMMHSFQLFGGDGLVDPGGVTGGVAQSLVATAIGLVVALFALFAFNYFSRRLERLMDELESFANARLSEIRLAVADTSVGAQP